MAIFLQVSKHLTKLFDSMAKLKFEKDAEGNNNKIALGMFSKDGEYVQLNPHPCNCDGQVSGSNFHSFHFFSISSIIEVIY